MHVFRSEWHYVGLTRRERVQLSSLRMPITLLWPHVTRESWINYSLDAHLLLTRPEISVLSLYNYRLHSIAGGNFMQVDPTLSCKFLISTFLYVCELSLLMFYYLRLLNERLTFVGRNERGSSWSLFEVQAHTYIGIKKAKTFTKIPTRARRRKI